jgi:NAD(P)-dependent dehydrogenase (short-subunit alcohol dehydrogenase family)
MHNGVCSGSPAASSKESDMTERVVLVTGGTGGIGKATARLFAGHGFVTYATDRSGEHTAELEDLGCHPVAIDVTEEPSVLAGIKLIEERDGGVDILINCAGYSQGGAVEDVPLSAFRRQFEVNVFGIIRLIQLVVPGMRRRGFGRIVNVSSVAGRITMPGMGAYAMSKHALECLDEVLRYELRPFNIRVATVQPGGTGSAFARVEEGLFARAEPGGPYGDFGMRVLETLRNNPVQLEPRQVAGTIFRAATVARPRRSYPVGIVATAMLGIRSLLPDVAWDRVASMVFPMPSRITAAAAAAE